MSLPYHFNVLGWMLVGTGSDGAATTITYDAGRRHVSESGPTGTALLRMDDATERLLSKTDLNGAQRPTATVLGTVEEQKIVRSGAAPSVTSLSATTRLAAR